MPKHLLLFFLLITSLSCCLDSALPNCDALPGSNDALTEKGVFQAVNTDIVNSGKENLTYPDHKLSPFFCLFAGDLENKEKDRENSNYLSTQINFYPNHTNLGYIFITPVSRPFLTISLYLFNCTFLI